MKLRAVVQVDMEAGSFGEAAKLEGRLEELCKQLHKEFNGDATYELRPRRDRSDEPQELPPVPKKTQAKQTPRDESVLKSTRKGQHVRGTTAEAVNE